MSWLNIMTLLTHFFYWWKGYVFVVTKIIIFFGYTSRYLVYRVVAQLCACRIIHLDLVAKSLLLLVSLNDCYETAVNSLTTTTIFYFFLDKLKPRLRFDDFLLLYHQCFSDSLYESQVERRSDGRKIYRWKRHITTRWNMIQ